MYGDFVIMGEIKNVYELLGRFFPFFASFVWTFLLGVSLADSKMRQKHQLKWCTLLFFTLLMLGCLLPIVDGYFTPASIRWSVLIPMVLIWFPVIGYRLVWCMTGTGKEDSFPYVRHYISPLVCILLSVVAETLSWTGSVRGQLDCLYLIVVSLFMVYYLLLSFIRIRRCRSAIDAKMRKTRNAKRWHRFVTKVALVTTLSPGIILFPQNTRLLFLIYLALMFTFVIVSSYLCYCSVFRDYAQPMPLMTTLIKRPIKSVVKQTEKSNRRIAKVSKNANGRMEMEPLTSKRFEEYMEIHKPYLDANFRMTDLEEVLGANRTVISNFVNRTYNMNFNRYINHLRIKEVERLQKLSGSGVYTLHELIREAGFRTMRNYTRAIDIQKDNKMD